CSCSGDRSSCSTSSPASSPGSSIDAENETGRSGPPTSPTTRHPRSRRSVMATPFERVGLVINPTAGASTAGRVGSHVAAELRARRGRYRDRTGADAAQALDQIRSAVAAESVACIIVVGGDGIVNLAVNGLAESEVPLLIIPAG